MKLHRNFYLSRLSLYQTEEAPDSALDQVFEKARSFLKDRAFDLITQPSNSVQPLGPSEIDVLHLGCDFDQTRCNTFRSHVRATTPVGLYLDAPEGRLAVLAKFFRKVSKL